MLESELQFRIRTALGLADGCVFWRNNVGVARSTDRARHVKYGLAVGSADLIGIVMVEINNRKVGRFVALEIKARRGRQSLEQGLFQGCVELYSGVYAVVHDAEEALAIVEAVKRGVL